MKSELRNEPLDKKHNYARQKLESQSELLKKLKTDTMLT